MAQAMGQRRRQVSGTPEKIQSGDRHAGPQRIAGKPAGTQRIGPRITFSQKLAWSLAIALPLGFLGLFFAWPVASLVMRGLLDNGRLDLAGVGEVFLRERTIRVVGQTLYQAAWATGISALAALPGAHLLYRRRFVGVGLLKALVIVPFVLPSVAVGVAFHSLLTKGGWLESLGLDGTSQAVIAAMVFFNYGFMLRQVGSFWAQLDPRPAQAAASLGAGPARVFFTITLPRLAPMIAAAASVTFLYCCTAYGVVLVLGGRGVSTIETEIYVLTAQFLDLRGAAVLSVAQIVLVAACLLVAERARRRFGARSDWVGQVPASALTWRDLPAIAFTTALIGGLLVAPIASLLVRSFKRSGEWTLANYLDLFNPQATPALLVSVEQSAWFSLRTALTAGAIAMVVGVCIAVVVSRQPRSTWAKRGLVWLDGFFMLPLGVSAVTVGFGFLITLARPPLALTKSWWIVPLAQAVVAVPLVVRTLVPALRGIDPRQREAAASLGAGPGRVIGSVDGPVLWRSGGLAAGFALATSLGEFGATSFLARPQSPTLPVVVAQLISRPGAVNQGMAIAGAVVLALGSASIMLICEYLQGRATTRRPGSRKPGTRKLGSRRPGVGAKNCASAKGMAGQKTASSHRPGVGRKRTASAINKD